MVTEDDFLELRERWAESYRLPVLRDLHAPKAYVSALVLFEEESPFAKTLNSVVPTEEEADLLGLYIQYRNERWLSPRFIREMKEQDSVDIDPGVNTYFFLKSAHRGWLYRMNSWTMGPLLIPNYDSVEKFALLELLDKITSVGGEPDKHWEEFKLKNYVFPV